MSCDFHLDSENALMDSHLNLDALDMQIIEDLQVDPRVTNKKIATRHGIAEATVANRIRALADDHVARVTAQRDLFAMGLRVMAFIFVSVSGRSVDDVADDLAELEEAISVSHTLGKAHLLCTIVGETRKDIQQVISAKAGAIDGIAHITCDICLDILKFETGLGDLHTPPPHIQGESESAEKDEFIIRQLQLDGRISNREIARQLGVSEANIRQRLKRLTESGAIKLSVVCDPFRLGLGVVGLVRMNVSPRDLDAAARSIAALPDASFVGYTTGHYNLMSLIPARDAGALSNLMNNQIRNLGGVGDLDVVSVTRVAKQRYDLIRII